jgi:hypothetical protein
MKVERVVLNALPEKCGFAAGYLRLRRWFGIVFGEADPPSMVIGTRCNQHGRVCESECAA